MAQAGLPEYPQDLLEAVREMFPQQNHPELHRFIAIGSAHRVRNYLWQARKAASRSHKMKKALRLPPGQRPNNYAMRRLLAREDLFRWWQEVSAEVNRAGGLPRVAA